MLKPYHCYSFFLLVLVIASGCGGDDPIQGDDDTDFDFIYHFDTDTEGWIGDFADYPNEEGVSEFYEMEFGHARLPSPLDQNDGALRQSGSNRSDDLFMYMKREMSGLAANQNYWVKIQVEFATDAASGAVGIGGAPGESVYLKAGATTNEPMKELQDENMFRMNIDKGNQSQDGADMKNIGDFANGTDDFTYALKSLEMDDPLLVQTNDEGVLWLIVGTDSGFEGITTIYYNSISVSLTRP